MPIVVRVTILKNIIRKTEGFTMFNKRFIQQVLVGMLLLLTATGAFAQATRTWISGVGDDANPCSRTAPCKTFAGAISKTAAGGTIDVLDPGGFGAVTITKAITLENVGEIAGVLVSGTNGIIVNAGVSDTVVLRGLSIDGIGTGLNGVRFLAGGKLVVERCVIQNFTQNGIDFEPSGTSQLVVTDTTINNNNLSTSSGVMVAGTGTGVNALVDRSRIVQNGFGVQVKNGNAMVRNSTVSQNNVGIKPTSSTVTVRVAVDDSIVSDNTGAGITTSGSQASVVISRSTISNNLVGVGGTVSSFGDNRIFNNTSDGSPSGSLPLH